MQFFSTRNAGSRVSAAQAIVQGLSSEGGLFVPESFPQADLKTACEKGSYAELAAYVLGLVLPGLCLRLPKRPMARRFRAKQDICMR